MALFGQILTHRLQAVHLNFFVSSSVNRETIPRDLSGMVHLWVGYCNVTAGLNRYFMVMVNPKIRFQIPSAVLLIMVIVYRLRVL